jgi:tetratricopeptide (TPR) repeat protein
MNSEWSADPNDDEDGPSAEPDADGLDADADADAEDSRESVYALLQRGQELLQGRHYAQAATVLARASRLEPGKGSILEALGRARYNSGQHADAAETFERLLDVDPSAHYAHYALGQSLKQLGRPREARTHLRLAVALSPNSRLYTAALARLGPPPESPPPVAPPPDESQPNGRRSDNG